MNTIHEHNDHNEVLLKQAKQIWLPVTMQTKHVEVHIMSFIYVSKYTQTKLHKKMLCCLYFLAVLLLQIHTIHQ